jgi:tetratricopeptide (TPR) repeat protein
MTTRRYRILAVCALTVVTTAALGCGDDPQTVAREAASRGDAFFEKQQYNEASLEYRRALQSDPNLGEVRHRLAETYLQTNNPREAVREIIRAADLLPENAEVQVKAGNALLMAGRFEDARTRADQVLVRDPQHVSALILRANALAGLRDLDGALADLEEAVAAQPQRGQTYAALGAIQQLRGEQPEADGAFKKAVEIDPSSAAARLAYANYLLASQRVEEAEAQLTSALSLDDTNVMINRALALFYVVTARPLQAEPYLKRLAQDANNTAAQFSLAQFYLATNRRDDAVTVLNGLAARDNTFERATLAIAQVARASGDGARGHTLVQQVLTRSPNSPQALIVRARFLLGDGKPAEAIASASAAVGADPSLPEAFFLLGEGHRALRQIEEATSAYNEVLKLRPNEVRTQVALSTLSVAAGELETAKQLAESAVRGAPRAFQTRSAVVRAALAAGDTARASNELGPLMRDFPQSAEVHTLDGMLRILRKDLTGAERAFATAEKLQPSSTPAAAGLVTVDLLSGRAESARRRVDALTANPSASVDSLMLAARTYGGLRDLARAEALLRRAIEAEPSRPEPYGLLGQIYLQQGRGDQALAEFQTLAARRPKWVPAQTMVAVLLHAQGRKPQAKDAYRAVLAIDSSAAVAANNLAWLMAEDNENLDEALQLAQSAKARMPESADIADTLGWIYLKKGMATLAVTELKASVDRNPENASFKYHLGMAYAESGNLTGARQVLEAALKQDPNAAEAADARRTLARLAVSGS